MSANSEARFVYADAPRNVYWETTVACQLACQHCRAEALPQRDPLELSTEEGKRLIDSVKALESLLVLTGGDPLEREDLFELIAYARDLHVPVAVTPSTTPSLTREKLSQLRDLGIATLGISLDGPTGSLHDQFRGVKGTFQHSMNALGWARELGVGVQINTTVTRDTQPQLGAMFELLASSASPPVRRWSLFLLIPTGRGSTLGALQAKEVDALFDWTYRISEHSPFHVSTVEAPHYRRHWIEQRMAAGMPAEAILRQAARMGFGIRDGNGVVFVARNGDVFPAGFLPFPKLGNVREQPLDHIYRTSPELASLRDMDQLTGKCGRCTYRWLCGGSRARAWSVAGDLLGDDPACAYDPPAQTQPVWPAL
ncbi:MAG TPA: TIGR04053 family radical SAM/SPASM domain-containing protein [Polyangiaceae bacterium]